MQANYPLSVWTLLPVSEMNLICLQDPMDQAQASTIGCLAKGRKAGTGEKVANMMVATGHGIKGIVICKGYEKLNNILYFDQHFNTMFAQ